MGGRISVEAPPWTPIPLYGELKTQPGKAVTMMNAQLDALKTPELAHLSESDRTDLVLAVGRIAHVLDVPAQDAEGLKSSFDNIMHTIIESTGQNG